MKKKALWGGDYWSPAYAARSNNSSTEQPHLYYDTVGFRVAGPSR